MQVRFANTCGELYRFQLSFMVRQPIMWAAYIALALFVTWNSMDGSPGPFVPGSPNPTLLAVSVAKTLSVLFFVGCASAAFAAFFVLGCLLSLTTKASKEMRTERVLTLTDESLISELHTARIERPWAAILKVRQNRRMIFIGTAQGTILVPRRAFGSESDALRFFQMACERRGRAVAAAGASSGR